MMHCWNGSGTWPTDEEDTPAGRPKVIHILHSIEENKTHFCERLLITPGVVSNCFARAKIHAMPIPESKSGTMAASVMIKSNVFLRRSLQFCGSKSESVGWGQRTLVPSADSFSFDATSSPSSIFASLKMKMNNTLETSNRAGAERNARRVYDQAPGPLLMERKEVNFRFRFMTLAGVASWV